MDINESSGVWGPHGEYWAVDLHGLTAEGAAEVVRFAADGLGFLGTPLSPRDWFFSYLDIATAQAVANVLEGAAAVKEDDGVGVGAYLDDLREWLNEVASPQSGHEDD